MLDRFNAAQLDAVLDRDDSAEVLGRLAASGNLFLISLDGQRVWYRYHRLFGDVLRDRLQVSRSNRFRELAIRAADMLEGEGDIDGALLQALSAGDRARAAALAARDAVRLGFDGRAGVLARRLGLPRIPDLRRVSRRGHRASVAGRHHGGRESDPSLAGDGPSGRRRWPVG